MTAELTIGFSVYGQPAMLNFWMAEFRNQPREWIDKVEVIVVDDCGNPPAVVPKDLPVSLYRVKKDIPWNQAGARNLVAHVASTQRLMLIDPDMTLPDGMLQRLVEESRHLTTGLAFRPALVHVSDRRIDHTSPNVHLLLREDFLLIGGYDEDYCGSKGWSDVQLLRVMQKAFTMRQRDDLYFHFHHQNKSLPDAQVFSLDRSTKKNKALHIRKMALLKNLGWRKFARKVIGERLRFPWEKVQ